MFRAVIVALALSVGTSSGYPQSVRDISGHWSGVVSLPNTEADVEVDLA